MKIKIIYEDQQLIVCEKPAGVPSQSDKTMDQDMVNLMKNHLYESQGRTNPYVGLVHRLDRPVGGIMVFGKTKEATAALSKQIQQSEVDKRYLAVVTTAVPVQEQQEWMVLEEYLLRDGRTNLSKVVAEETKEVKKAVLEYRVLETKAVEGTECSLLEVHLLTGRHHQIRVQLSHHFEGIWGDTKYNPSFGNRRGWSNIALYSHRLEFVHPKTKKPLVFEAAPSGHPFSVFELRKES